jgi:Tol biopolymer transport system component
LSTPEQLNHYRILHQLGKGGMGEVFAAEDTRLHRKVAIKVLSKLTAGDPERRLRFEREAQAIAALNHPNIVTIYSVEEADGVPFLTMELVEGRPLNELIPNGGLPLDALLRIGIAVSDAIGAAHQRGITHRDLKPANVMVTPDGRAKVLDFGLAKLRDPELDPDGLTRLPSDDLTGEGRIIGTVAYMSPEQAEGKSVDQRSDIFSLGVILHELGTGQRPFKGDTNVSVISSILKDTPSAITDLNPNLPPGLSKIIRRSLAKDPSRRYQTATDLRNELEELKQEVDSGVTMSASAMRPASGGAGRGRGTWIAAAIALIAVSGLGVALYMWKGAAPAPAAAAFEPDRFTRLTSGGNAFLAAISGDARYIVHIKNTGLDASLWVRQTATQSDVQIVAPARVRYDGLSYSPDGDYVYYVIYELAGGVGTLYKVPVLGGVPQRILEDVDSRVTFSPDAARFAFMRGAPARGEAYLMIAEASGANPRQAASLALPEQFQLNGPSWSPDGRTILASAQSLRGGPSVLVYAVDVDSGSTRTIGTQRWRAIGDIEWMPDGQGFIMSAAEPAATSPQIWHMDYPTGGARRVTNDLNNYIGVSLSDDGRSIATVQAENTSNLWVMQDGDAARGRQLTTGRNRGDGLAGLSWTKDGRIVFSSVASGRPEIWMIDADGSNARQLTNHEYPSMVPSASPDGKYIVFQRFRSEGVHIWRMLPDGSDAKPLTTGGAEFQPVAGPDGSVFYFSPTSGQPITYKVPIEGGEPVKVSDDYFRPASVTPDGRLLLGIGWDADQRQSSLATLPTAGGPSQLLRHIPFAGGVFAPGGTAVTHISVAGKGIAIVNSPLEPGPPKEVTTITDNVFGYAWSLDGRQLAVARGTGSSDVVLITAR